ncbi:hypothetical protein L3Q82_013638, partial [Scortum barcoo]
EFSETSKENLRVSVTLKERSREPIGCLGKDSRGAQRPSAVTWCETPKAHKRDASVRHRLVMCKPTADDKTDQARSPSTRRTEASIRVQSEHWLSASFDSLDTVTGALASSTLRLEQDLPLSSRKRRILFTQVRTSTLEDANSCLPHLRKTLKSPIRDVTKKLYDSFSVLWTPSSTQTPKCFRSVCEDSGFSSLTLDKSQDSSVDHDGSFQELLLSAPRGNCETPNLAETKRRSRLQRQHRLSTLKEGGSQSEEDPTDRKHNLDQCHGRSKDEVFTNRETPRTVLSVKCGNGMSSAKQDYATPLRATTATSANMTPFSIAPANPDVTPLSMTPVDLSLTPALQLVHAMCQQKAQMFVGQSPSLKEQLKSTVALTATPVVFRTTMPLAGLIGRKMGLGKVDILTELKKRNLRHILAVILGHLSSESIYRCGQVCKSWNEIIQQDKQASCKRRKHLSEVAAALELGGAVHVPDAETRLALLKRSALKTVQAQSRTSSFCTPQSGNSTLTPLQHSALHSGSSSKREKFLEENILASDDLLVHFFNDFLSLPCFPEALLYNQQTGQFEVVSGAAESVSRRIRSALHCSKSQLLSGDPTVLAKPPQLENHYTVCCLDREQGIQWIMKERLPFFLHSDCYNEYRYRAKLSKLLFQWDPNLCIQRRKGGSGRTTLSAPQLRISSKFGKENKNALKVLTHSHSQEIISAKQEGAQTEEHILDICCHGTCCHGSRPGLDEFKEFLRGTAGEKLLNLWMDIERLKATQNRERKNRLLVLMRSRYLLSSSRSSLNVELLSRLGLSTSPCWTEEKLHSVQPLLTESLLCYWTPRFWTSQCVQEDCDDSPHLGLSTDWCVRPLSGIQTHHGSVTLPPLRPHTCLPESPHTVHTELYCSRGHLLGSRRLEKMLQALCVDSCAGLYFTHFCEQSGNQLWVNAVNFWTDLQHYHELFYQDGLDPYRVQREAQLLYSTYLFSSARRSVGVDEEIRREVYDRLMPAFEELFDKVEEHTLNILLEPWTLLVGRDKESFQEVCVQEEVRCVDSQEYRELQSLYEESERRLKQVEQCGSMLFPSPITPSTPFSKGPRVPESWSRVSPNYQGYRLGSLLRHRHEIGHFMSFLQNRDASIHLMCWLDLEQYRRTSQKDKAVRQERSSHIANKYLNTKYFFGSDSPATTEQQNDILRLAGGLERLKLECLSNPVVVEIQDVVRSHIEKNWLPLFLSTAEFTERQKHKPKPQAADRLSQHVYHRRRARREAWKAEGLWMSSSKEILLLRRILLNPVTCTQFQHFLSLKGDFLENDILFWLEVQRYKDLCHSHSDEATIQQKISTIINCFIHSSMPPALQIDIPPEQAQHILEKRHELGPYIFREAQVVRKRLKHRARVRRQRRKEEEEEEEDERRRAQEDPERPESSFREEEETDEEDEDEEEEGRSEKKESRTQSRVLLTPTQPTPPTAASSQRAVNTANSSPHGAPPERRVNSVTDITVSEITRYMFCING